MNQPEPAVDQAHREAVARFVDSALDDPGIATIVKPWLFRIRVFRLVNLYAPGMAGTAYRLLEALVKLWEEAKRG